MRAEALKANSLLQELIGSSPPQPAVPILLVRAGEVGTRSLFGECY